MFSPIATSDPRPSRRRLTLIFSLLAMAAAGGSHPLYADGKDKEKPMKAIMVHYSGNVQGVGFRATAVMIARDFPVVGWVRNLSDGRVQLLAEGPTDQVDKFLKAIREHWKGDIEKEQTEEQKPTGKYKDFGIMR
jgi:acylphosphatase